MIKKIIVYFGKYPENSLHSYEESLRAIANQSEIIHTTCTKLLNFDFVDLDYELYFSFKDGSDLTQAKIGKNTWTKKDIRRAHNIEKMICTKYYSANLHFGAYATYEKYGIYNL